MRRLIFRLLMVMVLVGCSRAPEPPAPLIEPPALPSPPAPPVPPALPTARDLFPQVHRRLIFDLTEPPGGPLTEVTEDLVVEPGRAVAVYGGAPYAEWLLREDGVWRADGETLLRYLPPALEHGMVWRQGDVWFHLSYGDSTCRDLGLSDCWNLLVLGGGAQTRFTFAAGYGPVLVEAADFVKRLSKPAAIPERLDQHLSYRPSGKAAPAPVIRETVAAFDSAAQRMALLAAGVTRVDLDGDGQPEIVSGKEGEWSRKSPAVFRQDGTEIFAYPSNDFDQRIRTITLPQLPHPLLAYERRMSAAGPVYFTLLYVRDGVLHPMFGWAGKAMETPYHRLQIEPDGTIVAELDMGDPAGHTRITRFRVQDHGAWLRVVPESVRYMPTAGELLYPATPDGVLQAAFVARWIGLEGEVPRYFGSPEVAELLLRHPKLEVLEYVPGDAKIGRQVPPAAQSTWARLEPAPVGADGWTEFLAISYYYEAASQLWGRVRFGTDSQGRPVILELIFEGEGYSSV